MSYKIIVLSGRQGSGKSTISKELKERYERVGLEVACLKFADVLYHMHDEVLKVLHEYMEPRDIVKDGPLLQLLGTEWGRKTLGEDIWVNIMKERIRKISEWTEYKEQYKFKFPHIYIIDDCRFENEFNAFPEALRVRLHASEEVRKKRCSMWRDNTQHPSEIGLDEYEKAGMFDLYLDTGNTDVQGCINLILAQIAKNVWMEKRK